MGKVYNTTYVEDSQYLLSQTPPNHVSDNYYLKEMQDKVDADWRFRPNRKWIEQELEPGSENYTPIEIVIQSVHNEKGEKVSDDWYKLVFRDCLQHNRLGKRYRFSYRFDPEESDLDKNIWLGVNQNSLSATSSQVICRCNGNIGSIYVDENGKNHIHYEPVVQPNKLTSANFQFNEIAIDPRSQMTLIAQHNKYTEQYYINQRFIIGYDQVYKVNNIIKSDSLTTFDSHDVGLIKIYLDQDQKGKLDDFDKRIAYNGVKDEPISPVIDDETNYSLIIAEPNNIPEFLTQEGITFKPQVLLGGIPQSIDVSVNYILEGPYSQYASVSDFCIIEDHENGAHTIKRIKENLTMQVKVVCGVVIDDQELKLEFAMHLRDR